MDETKSDNTKLILMLKEKFKKVIKKEYLLLIFFTFVILSFIILEPISDLDEIWNYNTARAVLEGLIPYKEVSMITTSLVPLINAFFLLLLGNQVLTIRIVASILCASILFLTFNIFRKIFKETNISLICVFLIFGLCNEFFCMDYNFFVLFLVLGIINLELKFINIDFAKENWNTELIQKLKWSKKRNILIGILAGLSVCTKQSVGAFVAVITIFYPFIWLRKRKDFKDIMYCVFQRFIGICIPNVVFLLYLVITNSFLDFIDYGVIGISQFDNKIPYERLFEHPKKVISILARAIPILLIFSIFFNIFTKKNKVQNRNLCLLMIYSIPMLILMYPISDAIHFVISIYIFNIVILYLVFGIFGKWVYDKIKLKKKKKIYKIATLIIFIIMFAILTSKTINNYFEYFKQDKNHGVEHYSNISIEDYLIERISEIDKYILEQEKQGKKVYILDSEAAVYNIPLNIYNKDYDMFLKGNIGKDGEEGLIKKVQEQAQDENALFLIRNTHNAQNWQTPMKVVNYIRENFNKVDDVSFYEVYISE